jgi:Mechanosensitive ion channel, conserved TM helix
MLTHVNEILNQAATRIAKSVGNFLPGLLALAALLIFAVFVGWIARVMIRRSLRGIDFDNRLERWGFSALADWSPSRSPTLLIAGLAFWCVILLGLLVGLSALDSSITSLLVVRLFTYLPNVFAAILILIVGVFVARFLARGVLISAVNMQVHSARLVSLGVKWLVMVMAGAMALDHLGIGGEIVRLAFAILFGGIVLALALAVGLGSKEMVSRSLERQAGRSSEEEEAAGRFHNL